MELYFGGSACDISTLQIKKVDVYHCIVYNLKYKLAIVEEIKKSLCNLMAINLVSIIKDFF